MTEISTSSKYPPGQMWSYLSPIKNGKRGYSSGWMRYQVTLGYFIDRVMRLKLLPEFTREQLEYLMLQGGMVTIGNVSYRFVKESNYARENN